jgi:hypothetical protein
MLKPFPLTRSHIPDGIKWRFLASDTLGVMKRVARVAVHTPASASQLSIEDGDDEETLAVEDTDKARASERATESKSLVMFNGHTRPVGRYKAAVGGGVSMRWKEGLLKVWEG